MRTQSLCLALAIVLLCPFASAQWVQASGPFVGRINCFAASGTNLFVGTDGGVFLSTDSGTSWTAVNNGLTDTSVYALAVGGTNLFARTDSGTFLSTNNGTNWTRAFTPFRYFFQMVQLGTNLFAVADTNVLRRPFLHGPVYQSTDNGLNWTAVDGGLSNRHVSALAISGTSLFAANPVSFDSCYIFASTDSGASWTEVGSCIPSAIVSLVATSDGTLLAETYQYGLVHPSRLLLSTNGGVDWTQAKVFETTPAWNLAVSDTTLFVWTSDSVFLSTDNGTSWTGNPGPSYHALTCISVFGTKLLAGTYDGVFQLSNNSKTWTRVGIGLQGQDIWPLAECRHQAGGTIFFAGTQTGVFLSTDNGTDWTASNTPFENFSQVVYLSDRPFGAGLFAGTYGGGGVCLSTDNGASWTPVNTGMPLAIPDDSTHGYAWVTALAVSGTNLFAGTEGGHGVYRSNMGTTWTAVNTGLRDRRGDSTSYYRVSTLAVIDSYIFAGTPDGVFLSTNNGTSWVPANQGLPKGPCDTSYTIPIECVAVSGANLFAGSTYSCPDGGFMGGVFLSTDKGASWTEVGSGLPSPLPPYDLALAASASNIFAAMGENIYLSTNNGKSWTAVSSGLPNINVQSLAVSATHLFAGTWGEGVWRRPLSEMITGVEGRSELPTQFTVHQNYPNPFNPSTTIKYELPRSSVVRLCVYDILGREVTVLVNERRDAGVYKVKFDGSNLASGVYLYRLQAGEFVQSRKLLLLR
jgi:photosystem II stability/assembly factor-like uncharacterized protein